MGEGLGDRRGAAAEGVLHALSREFVDDAPDPAAAGEAPAQVALRWAVQRGVLPIPKATSAARLRENLGALEFSLDGEAMGAIDGLEADDRYSFDPRLIA